MQQTHSLGSGGLRWGSVVDSSLLCCDRSTRMAGTLLESVFVSDKVVVNGSDAVVAGLKLKAMAR